MKIFLVTQEKNKGLGCYKSMLIIAKNGFRAKHIHPYAIHGNIEDSYYGSNTAFEWVWCNEMWAQNPSQVKVYFLGKAKKYSTEKVLNITEIGKTGEI